MSQSKSSFSSTSISYSSSSSTIDGQKTGHRTTQESHSDDSGHTISRTTQDIGEPEVRETHRYDAGGRKLPARIEDQKQQQTKEPNDEQQAQRDGEYEERMEDEYAKREGGA